MTQSFVTRELIGRNRTRGQEFSAAALWKPGTTHGIKYLSIFCTFRRQHYTCYVIIVTLFTALVTRKSHGPECQPVFSNYGDVSEIRNRVRFIFTRQGIYQAASIYFFKKCIGIHYSNYTYKCESHIPYFNNDFKKERNLTKTLETKRKQTKQNKKKRGLSHDLCAREYPPLRLLYTSHSNIL